jgi:transcriptional regulator with XRE-family HTH domain
MHPIEQARKQANLTGAEIAKAVGRTSGWLAEVESGNNSISSDTERIVLTAISRLERFHRTVEEAKEKLTADLRLPPSNSKSQGAHPEGNARRPRPSFANAQG